MKVLHRSLLSFHSLSSFALQSYDCLCLPGWEGEFCQWETDECSSNPCKNNATCTDLLNAYRWVAKTQLDGAKKIWMNGQARDGSHGRLVFPTTYID